MVPVRHRLPDLSMAVTPLPALQRSLGPKKLFYCESAAGTCQASCCLGCCSGIVHLASSRHRFDGLRATCLLAKTQCCDVFKALSQSTCQTSGCDNSCRECESAIVVIPLIFLLFLFSPCNSHLNWCKPMNVIAWGSWNIYFHRAYSARPEFGSITKPWCNRD